MKIPIAKLEKFVVPEKDATGGPMQHVWLDVAGRRLIATDGHMAARQTVEVTDEDLSGLIPVEAFDLARKELKVIVKATDKETVPDSWLKVTAGEDFVVIENLLTNTTHLVKRPKLQDNQKYPTVDAVFPKLKAKPTVTLNGDILAGIIAALSVEGCSLSFWATGTDKVVAIASESGEALAVLMPMRGEPDAEKVTQRGESTVVQRFEKIGERLMESLEENRDTVAPGPNDTTVQIGIPDGNGGVKYTEPMSHDNFVAACEKIAGKVN